MTLTANSPELHLSKPQWLALKSLQGNLILQHGSITTGIAVSYTPANGKQFIYINASGIMVPYTSLYSPTFDVRINSVIIYETVLGIHQHTTDAIQGANLLGDGIKTVDINIIYAYALSPTNVNMTGVIL